MAIEVTIETAGPHKFLKWLIQRPERMNSIGTSVASELLDALNLVKVSPPSGIRAIVIQAQTVTKAQGPIWIAGGDLAELASLSADQAGKYSKQMTTFCRELERLPVPVIAFIDGAAIGGGAEVAISADIRVGTKDASFDWKQLSMGLATGYGAASRLCDLVGKAQTQRLLYFRESTSHVDALSLGLIHKVVDNYQGLLGVIEDLCKVDPRAIKTQKTMLHFATTLPRGDSTIHETMFESLWKNPTHQKVLDAFLSKKNVP